MTDFLSRSVTLSFVGKERSLKIKKPSGKVPRYSALWIFISELHSAYQSSTFIAGFAVTF